MIASMGTNTSSVPSAEKPVALISGATGHLGDAIARALATDGWKIAVGYRSNDVKANQLVEAIVQQGTEAIALKHDLSSRHAAQTITEQVVSRWGRIDALINCIGSYRRHPFAEISEETWLTAFNDNLHPVFYVTQRVLPIMQAQQRGRIINFAIVDAEKLRAQPWITAHYIAKVGVLALTRSIAKVGAPDGITANCISPGFIDSDELSVEERKHRANAIPLGRLGTREDVVHLIRFLLSPSAAYITGENIEIDGGWGLR